MKWNKSAGIEYGKTFFHFIPCSGCEKWASLGSKQSSGKKANVESAKKQRIFGEDQRWSWGHKTRGQGPRTQKNPRPRPRTAFPRTEPLEAKDRIAQGQGPRTPAQAIFQKKKKVFKNIFQAISNSLAYPKFLNVGGLNHKLHEMTSSKIFWNRKFLWHKDIVKWKIEIVVACLHVTRILQRERA